MPRAGLLALMGRSPAAPPPGGGPLVASFLQSAFITAGGATFTYAGQNLGPPSADRTIVVATTVRAAGTADTLLESVTIGGVDAVIDEQASFANSNQSSVAIARALVPAGTTGDIVCTWSRSQLRSGLGVWAVTGGPMAVHDSGSVGGLLSALDVLIGTPADGGWAASAVAIGSNSPPEWSGGVTEDFNIQIGTTSARASGASVHPTGTTLNPSVSVGSAENVMVAVSYAPA